MYITGQSAIVTGGGSGMGEAVSRALSQQGAQVAVLDLNEAQATRVANDINGIALVCDVSDAASTTDAFSRLPDDFKKNLKILVNCAGIAPAKRMVGKQGPVDLSWFENVIKINLVGTFNTMRLAVDIMMKHKKDNHDNQENGVIINTASIAAFEGQIGQSAYSASKGGVVGMTLPLARELASAGIRVMCVAPGLINTPMMQGMPENVNKALLDQTVYPKRLGEPEEFANTVMHVIQNPMLNGSVIRLDGAVRMGA